MSHYCPRKRMYGMEHMEQILQFNMTVWGSHDVGQVVLGWERDWDSQQGREMEPWAFLRSYAAPPPAPASPWPVDALALPPPSSCPPPLSAWRCSRSGPWCFLCCCRLQIRKWRHVMPNVCIQTHRQQMKTHQPPQVWFSGKMRSASPRLQMSPHSVHKTDKNMRRGLRGGRTTHTNTDTLTLSILSFWTPNFPPNPLE